MLEHAKQQKHSSTTPPGVYTCFWKQQALVLQRQNVCALGQVDAFTCRHEQTGCASTSTSAACPICLVLLPVAGLQMHAASIILQNGRAHMYRSLWRV